jgi:hypothetical protein
MRIKVARPFKALPVSPDAESDRIIRVSVYPIPALWVPMFHEPLIVQ